MAYKVDLHTHSNLSYDGMMNLDHYKRILEEGMLDYVAITDHNEIDYAKEIQEKLGDKIIVGEEIKTDEGDLIGLFMTKKIPKWTPLRDAAEMIKDQGGIVYVPHPFEIMRSGIPKKKLEEILPLVDIIESFNARYIFPTGNLRAARFALYYEKPDAAGSDSHSFGEIGRAYNLLDLKPEVKSLVNSVKNGSMVKKYVKPLNYLNPKKNRFKKLLLSKSRA